MSRPPNSRIQTGSAPTHPAKRKLLVPSSRGTSSANSPAAGSGRMPPGNIKDQEFGDELYQTGIKDESGRIKEYWVCAVIGWTRDHGLMASSPVLLSSRRM